MKDILLTDICRPKQWKTISMQEMKSSGYPVFGANGIIGFYDKYTHEEPTLLITCRGATCGTMNISLPFSYVNGNAMALDNLDSENVDLKFLFYYLKNRTLRDTITGTAQPQITRESLKKVRILLPPLPEQKRIAEVLDKADALREKRRLALQKLDTLLQSVFLEMFGDPLKNPKGWKETTISEICFVKGGKRLPKGDDYSPTPTDFRYIRVTDIKNGKIAEKQLHYLYPETQSQISRYIVNKGDVIISIAGSIGLIAPVPETLDGINLTENAAKLCPRKLNQYNSIFLSSILKSDYAQQQIGQYTGQVTIGKLALFRIEKIKILLPPIELQNEFETFVKKFEALKDRLNNSLKITENLFQSLQQRAFKGALFNDEFSSVEPQDEKVWQQTSLF